MLDIQRVLSQAPVIPVLTIENIEDAVLLGRALVGGGLTVLEITLRTPVALRAIAELRRAIPNAIVGAGTLTRTSDFEAAKKVDAQFAVSPGTFPGILKAAQDNELPLLPGVMTPSEVLSLRESGCSAMKLFPAQQAGGVEMLRALHAPIPDVVFCPTGGITRLLAPAYLSLPNVRCVGGSWVAPKSMIDSRDWQGIEELARDAASLRRAA